MWREVNAAHLQLVNTIYFYQFERTDFLDCSSIDYTNMMLIILDKDDEY